jgi:hypothetical protein
VEGAYGVVPLACCGAGGVKVGQPMSSNIYTYMCARVCVVERQWAMLCFSWSVAMLAYSGVSWQCVLPCWPGFRFCTSAL